VQEWGVRYAIVGVHAPEANLARRQIETCRNNGLAVPGVYDYLYFGESGEVWDGRRTAIRNVAKDMGMLDIWLDVEPGSNEGIGPDVIRPKLENAVIRAQLDNLAVGIYTRRTAWEPMTGSFSGYSHLPLMDAYYLLRQYHGTHADDIGWSDPYATSRSRICQYSYFVPYGGWTRPTIKQAAGTTGLCGVGVDLNWAESLGV
jgi:hypothetical protein